MEVTGEALLVDVYRTDSSATVVPEQIEALPVADRQFENLAFLAPGTQRDRTPYFDRTGSPVIGGSGNAAQSTILVDGVDVRELDTGHFRRQIGIVLQEPYLFYGSVLENIRYGHPEALLERTLDFLMDAAYSVPMKTTAFVFRSR